ncbi:MULTISPECIES: hypothetical protein [Brevibacillus]|jgi:hypothetical protein|uniref:Uncharacterized protein n=1 Tax=Brevibacillus parabrevis TaxID=54914 RepID=A0A4Y3PVP5_BREPA|nr:MULTISPECIES: hypothetical protein [Brevibacillus]TGV28995.1 hypothetical protein EN829_041845 [Mesorhizobium sp. M00.F.Ca.ET.186.01.1.1]MBU8716257.1 hypothetical protein [Brevibacillus parabrevis]MDH6353527.1 hypothetical protein [Brevibacillus sp. 1238]MDR5001415.1 hypothetical protein [Brevibacillus parabrevis]MED2258256.1 hypothetical protein [Brevibacillus parabrevis]
MATVEAHHKCSASVEQLLGRQVRYQKHKPGRHLSLERLSLGSFRIETVHRFGDRVVLNDGLIVMENAPAVMERGGRIALLFATGEELYLNAE